MNSAVVVWEVCFIKAAIEAVRGPRMWTQQLVRDSLKRCVTSEGALVGSDGCYEERPAGIEGTLCLFAEINTQIHENPSVTMVTLDCECGDTPRSECKEVLKQSVMFLRLCIWLFYSYLGSEVL